MHQESANHNRLTDLGNFLIWSQLNSSDCSTEVRGALHKSLQRSRIIIHKDRNSYTFTKDQKENADNKQFDVNLTQIFIVL